MIYVLFWSQDSSVFCEPAPSLACLPAVEPNLRTPYYFRRQFDRPDGRCLTRVGSITISADSHNGKIAPEAQLLALKTSPPARIALLCGNRDKLGKLCAVIRDSANPFTLPQLHNPPFAATKVCYARCAIPDATSNVTPGKIVAFTSNPTVIGPSPKSIASSFCGIPTMIGKPARITIVVSFANSARPCTIRGGPKIGATNPPPLGTVYTLRAWPRTNA